MKRFFPILITALLGISCHESGQETKTIAGMDVEATQKEIQKTQTILDIEKEHQQQLQEQKSASAFFNLALQGELGAGWQQMARIGARKIEDERIKEDAIRPFRDAVDQNLGMKYSGGRPDYLKTVQMQNPNAGIEELQERSHQLRIFHESEMLGMAPYANSAAAKAVKDFRAKEFEALNKLAVLSSPESGSLLLSRIGEKVGKPFALNTNLRQVWTAMLLNRDGTLKEQTRKELIELAAGDAALLERALQVKAEQVSRYIMANPAVE